MLRGEVERRDCEGVRGWVERGGLRGGGLRGCVERV